MLVVEDEASIASFVSLYLKNAGYEVRTATNGADALTSVQNKQPSLIVLDLMLPDIDGIEICRRIRQKSDVPILMLTARDEDVDKIIGLEVCADDYLTKPFNPRELVARVKSVLRRSAPERRRDVKATYNPMNRAQLAKLAPQLQWARLLQKEDLGKVQTVIVREPSAIAAIGKLIASTPLSTWKDYETFHFLSSTAQFLPKAFDDARFDFYGKTISEQPVQRDRWKRGVSLVNGALGEGVAAAVRGGGGGGTGQGHAEGLTDGGHGVGGVHAAAGTLARADGFFDAGQVLHAHLAGGAGAHGLEGVDQGDFLFGAVLELDPAGHDRAGIEEDAGQVQAGRRHQHAGEGLVAAGQQDGAVDPLGLHDGFH